MAKQTGIYLYYGYDTKKGGYVWFESVIHAIRDPVTGNVREFYNVSRDITARKQAKRERHEIKES